MIFLILFFDYIDERISQFYSELINYIFQLAESGQKLPISRGHGLPGIHHKEDELLQNLGLLPQSKLKVRKEYFGRSLYELMNSVEEQKEGTLDTILEKVRHPALDHAITVLQHQGGTSNTTVERFVEEFDPATEKKAYHHLDGYIKSVVLLNLVLRHPDIVDRLDESSCYFPHKLFPIPSESQKPKKLIWGEVRASIADTMLQFFSDEVLQAIEINDRFVYRRPNSRDSAFIVVPGIFHMPHDGPYGFQPSEPSKKPIDSSINPDDFEPLVQLYADFELRKELYEAVGNCLQIINRDAFRVGRPTQEGLKEFNLSNTAYGSLRDALRRYATNQFLWEWRERDFQDVSGSNLSRQIGLVGKVEDGKLIITEKRNANRVTYNPNAVDYKYLFHNSTARMPFITAILSTWYKAALKYANTN